MSKTEKMLPKLRFPEFKDCGEWEEEKLGEVATKNIDKTKGKRCKLMSITAGQGLISQIEKFGREIAGNSYNNYIVIKKDDFVYNKSSTKIYREGEIARYNDNEEGAVPNSIFISFKFDTAKVYPLFAGFLFEKNIHGYWLRKFISMGARAHGALQVNDEDFFAMPLSFPSIPEQQRIAACLSSLDELISAHSQKLELLKTHKKGLMQNMFPQEGEKVPKLRFKEFENDGEWEEKKLGEITEHVKEKVSGKKLMTVSISAGIGFVSQVSKFSRDISGNQYKNYTVLHEGDFSYNKGNSKKFPQGCIYKLKEFKQVAVPNAFISFRFKSNFIGGFYQGYFDNNYHGIQLAQFITSGVRSDGLLNIKTNDFFNIILPTPSIPEQQRIASCLSSLDELITAQSKKIEQLKQHKKGLMRGLFPKINE